MESQRKRTRSQTCFTNVVVEAQFTRRVQSWLCVVVLAWRAAIPELYHERRERDDEIDDMVYWSL